MGFKFFSMLNSTDLKFILLINVKMPLVSRINAVSESNKARRKKT